MAAVFARGGARQGHFGGLGRAVDALADLAERGLAGDEHHRPAGGLSHGRDRGAGHVGRREQVDLNVRCQRSRSSSVEKSRNAPAGVVDQDIDTVPCLDGGRRDSRRPRGSQVANRDMTSAAPRSRASARLGLRRVHVGHQDAAPSRAKAWTMPRPMFEAPPVMMTRALAKPRSMSTLSVVCRVATRCARLRRAGGRHCASSLVTFSNIV